MSTQAAHQFLEKLANDQDLVVAALFNQEGTREEKLAPAVQWGRQQGLEFTAQELLGLLEDLNGSGSAGQELSDADLESVSGGVQTRAKCASALYRA